MVPSARVGPEAIAEGGPSTTSEISRAAIRPLAAPARAPFFTAERCRRTMFISVMGTPPVTRARPTCCRSSKVVPAAGTSISDDPPPDTNTNSNWSERPAPTIRSAARPAARLARPG